LALAAWQALQQAGGLERVRPVRRSTLVERSYDVVLDGVFGFNFRPPLSEGVRDWFAAVRLSSVSLRAAVDLPSGGDDENAFQADITYATGVLKAELLELPHAGRLRYVDLGFFPPHTPGDVRLVKPTVLDPLRTLRPAACDKRSFGQLAVIGGSRSYPGAVGMSVAAALLSGVGNVTAFVPESIAPAMAARWPEAMWMGCPETEEGGLAIDASVVTQRHLDRATALLIGPGLGREAETQAFVGQVLQQATVPVVLDADALLPELVSQGTMPRILTPHAGEYQRIQPYDTSAPDRTECVWVRKGPVTRIHCDQTVYHVIDGGPELARGGSGDVLAGLIGGRLAEHPDELMRAAVEGACWHGRAALRVARHRGETAIRTTGLLDELNVALREN
jgi:NAD(P)H-hydrate epimerase